MAKGTNYGSERVIVTDPRSGLRVFRLSHGGCIGTNLYFEMGSFTSDERHVVFMSQRGAGRDAPWDLFRVQTDGMELTQVTDRDDLRGIVVCPALDSVFYLSGEELFRTHLLTLEEQAVARVPGGRAGAGYSLATIDAAGKRYFANCAGPQDGEVLFSVDIASGAVEVLHHSAGQNHLHVDPEGKTLHFNEVAGAAPGSRLIQTDGTYLRPAPFREFAHHTWFGTSGKMQGTLLPPGKAIALRAESDADFTILAEGRYYWHSGVSPDAQWIVSDTNWPQEGIFLLHVPTRRVTYVCDPGNEPSHPQWTHPHPSISPSIRYVLFNSDKTGLGQVYLAELTPEFIAQAQKPIA